MTDSDQRDDRWSDAPGFAVMLDSPSAGPRPELVLDALPDPVLVIQPDGILCDVTSEVTTIVGWERSELVGRSVLDLVHPDDLALVLSSMGTVAGKDVGELLSVRIRTSEDRWRTVEVHGRFAALGGHERIVIVVRDIAGRHRFDVGSGDAEVMRTVMATMHGMIALVEPDGRLRSINGAVTRVLGYDPELIIGEPFIDFVHHSDRPQVRETVAATTTGDTIEVSARFRDDRHDRRSDDDDHVTCEFTVTNLTTEPTVGGFVVSGHVATALHDAQRRVDFLAEHDSRTGLLNRDGFLRAAADLVEQGGGLGLMIVDVVAFRAINELYGEDSGDEVLSAIAQRIDEIRWPDLIVARFGGDEFVLAVRSADPSSIEKLVERIRRDVERPVSIGVQEIKIALRTAIAFEPLPQALDNLLANASNELMRVKRNTGRTAGGASPSLRSRRQHLDELKAALHAGQICPFFQPIVSASGRIDAVEALVRWVHPVRGVLGVDQILPLAQMAGLAEQVDEHVFSAAVAFARRLADEGHPDVEVHLNVDPKVIAQPDFASSFLRLCAGAGADPGQIVVELTETDLLAPGVSSLDNMHELRRAGTHVAIDDFGTGYSSLSHLLELPVDGVKIDRRFVAGIDVDPAATNLTTAILGLSDSLSLACVAEGVEQPYQRDRLAALGCRAFQGWLYSPAVPADDLVAMLPRIDVGRPAPVES